MLTTPPIPPSLPLPAHLTILATTTASLSLNLSNRVFARHLASFARAAARPRLTPPPSRETLLSSPFVHCTTVRWSHSTKVAGSLFHTCSSCPRLLAARSGAAAGPASPFSTPVPRGECRRRVVMRRSCSAPRTSARGRMTTCIWCHVPVLISAARRHEGLCPSCVSDNSELGWRTVFDRERGIGRIPANLREAYQL